MYELLHKPHKMKRVKLMTTGMNVLNKTVISRIFAYREISVWTTHKGNTFLLSVPVLLTEDIKKRERTSVITGTDCGNVRVTHHSTLSHGTWYKYYYQHITYLPTDIHFHTFQTQHFQKATDFLSSNKWQKIRLDIITCIHWLIHLFLCSVVLKCM